jgi:hypothetical protein
MFPLHDSNKKLRNGWMLTKNNSYNNEFLRDFLRIRRKIQSIFARQQLPQPLLYRAINSTGFFLA